jgi:mannosyltransferase OCH1-like enzyme
MSNNIFQILISDVSPSQEFLDFLKQRILEVYKDHNYTLYNDEMIRDFLNSYSKDVLNAYDDLLPYAFKADIARYCLLHEYGGWYFDVSVFPLFKHQSNRSAVIFHNPVRELIENSIMYFESKHPLLEETIKISVKNIKNKHYGKSPLNITGPFVLTSAFNSLDRNLKKNIEYGLFKYLDNKDITCKKWYEINKKKFSDYKKYKHEGGISHLGLLGTNRYPDMWRQKKVYK